MSLRAIELGVRGGGAVLKTLEAKCRSRYFCWGRGQGLGGAEHAGDLTFVGYVSQVFYVYCTHLSFRMLCGAGVLSACSTSHGSSFLHVLSCLRAAIPLSFVLLLRLCGYKVLGDVLWR